MAGGVRSRVNVAEAAAEFPALSSAETCRRCVPSDVTELPDVNGAPSSAADTDARFVSAPLNTGITAAAFVYCPSVTPTMEIVGEAVSTVNPTRREETFPARSCAVTTRTWPPSVRTAVPEVKTAWSRVAVTDVGKSSEAENVGVTGPA